MIERKPRYADVDSSMLKQSLTDNHKDLYQWFLFHQECLLLGNEPLAAHCLHVFIKLLNAHINFENKHLLAAKASTQFDNLRWQPSVYLQEHEKILALTAAMEKLFGHWLKTSAPRKKRLILLELLAKQTTLRQVIAHHEEREESDLFEHIAQKSTEWVKLEDLIAGFEKSKSDIRLFLTSS